LLAVASDHPERFSYDRTNFVGTHLRIGPDGVFVADQRVADAGQIVERIARDDVRSIVRPVRTARIEVGRGRRRCSRCLAGRRRRGGSGDHALRRELPGRESAGVGIIGLPVAGGLLGYHGFARKTAEVIYRARRTRLSSSSVFHSYTVFLTGRILLDGI
jgi:hypothetical protein